jgi:hypothetical protein
MNSTLADSNGAANRQIVDCRYRNLVFSEFRPANCGVDLPNG